MKRLSIGWEADMLYSIKGKPQGVNVIIPVLKPITIRAYQFDLAFMAWSSGGIFNSSGWAEVLFAASVYGEPPITEFGAAQLKDFSPTAQNLHGGGGGTGGLCQAILKGFLGDGMPAVNKSIVMTNLDIPVSAGQSLFMMAQQAGAGPLDFEVQANVFYV